MIWPRKLNKMINKVHERELRLVLNVLASDLKTLLQKNNDVCNHCKNIQTLLIEILKIINGLAPPHV